ncbi:MAG TPA: fused MFS/spermidine synthase [Longimicrobiales bacterium]|nr:fused MFS/spermidine synthase [Longimicrobiales bacterium]
MTFRNFAPAAVLALHAGAGFLAAALLFSLEPLVGKLLLPRLGGAPAVWNTCLLFFQAMLLAGYAYAHFGVRRLGVRRHARVHVVLVALSLAALPPALGAGEPPVESSPVGWLLLQLLRAIGLPFLVISATAPLVQKWFSASEHPGARDPYFLYAASNLGSLAGLLLYPLVLEPLLGLRMQARLWSLAYVAFAAVIALLALRARLPAADAAAGAAAAAGGGATRRGESVPARAALRWTMLAALPSALLLTVTGYVTTDVAPMPLLWLLPLGLYLLTFVVAFGARQPPGVPALRAAQPALAVLLSAAILAGFNPLWMVLVHLAVLGATAYLAHARLAAERPPPAQLTAFYVWLSVGGTLGGVFGVMLAPLLLMPELEYTLLLLAGVLLTTGERTTGPLTVRLAALLIGALGAGALLAGMAGHPALGVAALVLLLVGLGRRQMVTPGGITFMAVVVVGGVAASGSSGVVARSRNFFGTLRVREYADRRELLHGRTVHGVQLTAAGQEETPTAYYGRAGPLGDVFGLLPAEPVGIRVGVVGLGVGTTTCYARPGEAWDLFEIDPAVVALARDAALFTFLARCAPNVATIIGDGRRSLAGLPEARYDLLVLDAFSSDAIPVHLLTLEAFQLFLERLQPDGVLAVHISNKYLDLAPVLGANAVRLGLHGRLRADNAAADRTRSSSVWAVLARPAGRLARLDATPGWRVLTAEARFRGWTDDHASLLPVLRAFR